MNPRTRDERGYTSQSVRQAHFHESRLCAPHYVIHCWRMQCNSLSAIKGKREYRVITRCFSNSRKLNFAVVCLALIITASPINLTGFLEIYKKSTASGEMRAAALSSETFTLFEGIAENFANRQLKLLSVIGNCLFEYIFISLKTNTKLLS
jgi:hypothetical protein